MKKIKYLSIILIITFISLTPKVKANEGILYSPCSCFGKTYGIHNNHWHETVQNGNDWIAVGDPINNYPCNPNNDPTLKTLTINNTSITIQDKMEFKTYDENVTIIATPNNQQAKIEYEQTKKLNIGNNKITIKITGISGLIKTYELNIVRQKILSKNNNIKNITIDGKEYQFKDNIINDIFVTSNQKTLDIKITKEDKTSKITIKGNKNLKTGDNQITIISKAENGAEQKYYINYHKTMAFTDIIGTIIGILILASPLIIIIIIIILKNKKRYINNTHHYKKYKI